MSQNFLHGVETIDVPSSGGVLPIAKANIIALVGIAPAGPAQQLVQCLNSSDDAQFGAQVPGFNIPKTLALIRGIAGNVCVVVVNVFDDADNTAAISLETHTIANGKTQLANAPIGAVEVKDSNGDDTAFVEDEDYTIDAFGVFKVISGNIPDGTVLKFNYNTLDADTVIASSINGTTDGDGVRTGTKLYEECYNTFGYKPKIFVSPGYSTLSGVATNFYSLATKYRGVALIDAPAGTTVAGAIAGRNANGTINFNTSNPRVNLLYPQLKSSDVASGDDESYPYSAFYAAVLAGINYWESPSNREISIATGIEKTLTWNINDEGCEANQLNGIGIVVAVKGNGTGIRTWGNRNASYPTSTDVRNFTNMQRIDDVIADTMEEGAIEDLDKGITQAFIDNQVHKGNVLIAKLIQDGAIFPGSRAVYNQADNPPAELAAGHITFSRIYMGSTPAERITFKSTIDINLLSQLK